MRILVLGGTTFIGRRVVERLHERGDEVLVVHRGHNEPSPWVPVGHLRVDRRALGDHANEVHRFAPEAVVDTYAMTAEDVSAVLPVLPEVPTRVGVQPGRVPGVHRATSRPLRGARAANRGL